MNDLFDYEKAANVAKEYGEKAKALIDEYRDKLAEIIGDDYVPMTTPYTGIQYSPKVLRDDFEFSQYSKIQNVTFVEKELHGVRFVESIYGRWEKVDGKWTQLDAEEEEVDEDD